MVRMPRQRLLALLAALALAIACLVPAAPSAKASAVTGWGLGAAGLAPPPPILPYNVNIVIHGGQSLSVGLTATPSGTSTHGNLTLSDALVTWGATTAYAAHSWVSPGNKFAFTNATSCTSGSSQPAWVTTIGGSTPSDGTCTWTTDHAITDDLANLNEGWIANTTYLVSGDLTINLHPTNQPCIQKVYTGGPPSGSTQPSWNNALSSTTVDGSYGFTCEFTSIGIGVYAGGKAGAYGSNSFTSTSATGNLSLATYSNPPRAISWGGLQYPRNIGGNPPTLAFLDAVSALTAVNDAGGSTWVLAGADTGESGQGISVIGYGGTGNAFAAGIYEAKAIKAVAAAQGKTAGVVAILWTHGETDDLNTSYGTELQATYAAYLSQLQAVNGNSQPIPLIMTQQSTSPASARPISAYQMLGIHDGQNIVVAGPKYAEPRNSGDVHMTAAGYNQIGDLMAESFLSIAQGKAWHPLQPLGGQNNLSAYTASTSSTTITIALDNQYPPLVFDTTTVPLGHQSANTQWANGYGLEVWDSVGNITINSVSISGNSLVITLATLPHTGLQIAYASTNDNFSVNNCPGGKCGNIRNSNPYVGPYTGASLWDWLCIFESPALT